MQELFSTKAQFSSKLDRIEIKDLESTALTAKHRAIKARQMANLQFSYELGGWKSLFEEYTDCYLDAKTKTEQLNPEEYKSTESQESNSDRNKARENSTPLCPSAQPDINNAVVFGVVKGTVELPHIGYLNQSRSITEEISNLSHPIKPTEIFRIASSCQTNNCQHFDGADCRLAMRIVEQLPTVVERLPVCQIRSNCRWWLQEGKAACFRCPQVVTDSYFSSEQLDRVAQLNN
jgi:hypothetical protein